MLPKSFLATPSNNQPEIEPKTEIPTSISANAQPLQVYSRRRMSIPPPLQVQESNSQPDMETSPTINDLGAPIALRKGIRNCTQHPIYHFVSLDKRSPQYKSFFHPSEFYSNSSNLP